MAEKVGEQLRSGAKAMDYDETLMYGRYRKELGQFAKESAAQVRAHSKVQLRRRRGSTPSGFKYHTDNKCTKCKRSCAWFRDSVISRIGEDWVFLTLLGFIMALLSFGMDFIIEKCQIARIWLYEEVDFSVAVQYLTWVAFPLVFICFSTGFVHLVGPHAIGSGIPEMKTILRGVVLKEYLSFRTLISKIVGLCTSLGCGLPIGKEGPFVHIASIAATLLGKVVTPFRGIYENQSRNSEMLAAACAVGVACTFAAPIGGVLFSIEVTATYFAVRNYWRGFYSAVCGACIFRLLAIWFRDEETLTALFKTNLRQDFPFDPAELLAFAVIGIVCGFGGALFVYTHRKMVEFMRKQKKISNFLQKNRFLFPSIVTFVIMSCMFPPGLGQFMAGQLTNHQAVNELFSNWTWSKKEPEDYKQTEILNNWSGPQDNIYLTLAVFIIMRFWMAALANTLPVPAGVFIPVFTIGAAFGRLIGESMAVWFPDGLGGRMIVPGGYAIVGAAALSGSVTHTISTSVIVFELTGQMSHVLPCVIAVLIANAIAHKLQPSIYDSLILIKNLPYLPDIITPGASANAHQVYVDDFMIRDVQCLSSDTTYLKVSQLLEDHDYRAFPLVDSVENMLLIGSIHRSELEKVLDKQLSDEARMEFFEKLREIRENLPNIKITPPEVSKNGSINSTASLSSDAPADIHKSSSSQGNTPGKLSRFSVSTVTEKPGDVTPAVNKTITGVQRLDSVTSSISDVFDSGSLSDQFPVSLEDMTPEQETIWENFQLVQTLNLEECHIDPAPFQLVEKTSLYKVHSLFSLLSLHHAYVTNTGRLVGIVAMQEVRKAVQGQIQKSASSPPQRSGCIDSGGSDYDGIRKGPFQGFSGGVGMRADMIDISQA